MTISTANVKPLLAVTNVSLGTMIQIHFVRSVFLGNMVIHVNLIVQTEHVIKNQERV